MLKLIPFLTLSFLFSSQAFGKNYMAFMGGGGEPEGEKTIFDPQVSRMQNFVKSDDWERTVSFNGGHSQTEMLVKKTFAIESNPSFTEKKFDDILKDYETKINNGQITSGDQLMLIMATHGAENMPGQKTHQVSVAGGTIADFNSGQGSTLASMDKLQSLIDLAKNKGIKLAVLDLSCHSGNTLALKNDNTCIISATGPRHYGYAGEGNTFTNNLLSALKKGTSLEEAFLSAREHFDDRSFPMISTPVGLDVNNELYDNITPYLYRYDPKYDKFAKYISKEALKGEACEAPQEFESLKALIAEVESMKRLSKRASFNSRDGKKMETLLDKYREIQDRLRADFSALKLPDMKFKQKFCSPYKDSPWTGEACLEFTNEQLFSSDFSWLRNAYTKNLNNAKDEFQATFAKAALVSVDLAEAKRTEYQKNFPDLSKVKTFFDDQPKLESETTKLADDISKYTQELYQTLYLQKASEDIRPNPCKDFVI